MNGMAKLIAAVAVVGVIVVIAIMMMDPPAPVDTDPQDKVSQEIEDPKTRKSSGPPIASLAPAKRVEVTGTVLDEAGQPIEGATVLALREGGSGDDSAETRTDAEGAYRLEITAGKYQFSARFPRFREGREKLTVGDEGATVDFTLVSGLTISGYVEDFSGKRIPNALVRAFIERMPKEGSMEIRLRALTEIQQIQNEVGIDAITDSNGYYELKGLEQKSYDLKVIATGFTPESRRFVEAGSTDVNFQLVIGGRIIGRISSADGGVVDGAVIHVREQANKDETDIVDIVMSKIRPPLIQVEGGAGGSYVVEGVGGDMMFSVVVEAPGHQATEVENVVVATGGDTVVDITMDSGNSLQGVVYDPAGRPLAGARVKVNVHGAATRSPNAGLIDDGILTDDAGRFLFDTLQSGQYRLVASHPDYATHVESKLDPNGADLEIQLGVGAAISGVIVDVATNAPIEGAEVTVQDPAGVKKTDVTNAAGLYEVRGIFVRRNKSQANLSVDANGYARMNNEKVAISDGEVTPGIDFALEKNGQVIGLVTDVDGKPVGNASVHVKRRQTADSPVGQVIGSITQVGSDGRFIIENVTPAEECYIVGTHSEHLESYSDLFAVNSGEQTPEVTLILRRGGSIEGVVFDMQGQPIGDVIVAVRDDRLGDIDPASLDNQVRTGADGFFRLSSIEPGDATIVASKPGYLRTQKAGIGIVEDRATQGIELKLIEGAKFSGLVTDTTGAPVVGASIEILDTYLDMRRLTEKTDTNGYFQFDDLGPDPVRVDVEKRGFNKETRHEQPVNTEGNDFTLSRLGGLSGVVVNQHGEPIKQFSVAPSIVQNGRTYRKVASKTFNVQDGVFSFPGLEPGQYEIAVGTLGFSAVTLSNVTVREDQDTDLGRVQLTEGGKIAGWIIDQETGEPIRGVRIKVLNGPSAFQTNPLGGNGGSRRDRRSQRGSRSQFQTDLEGHFLITGLNVDSVRLEISHVHYMTLTEEFRTDVMDNRIELSRGGLIEGAVTSGSGEPQSGVQLLLSGQGKSDRQVTDRKGSFTFSGLADGSYTIRIWNFGIKGKGDGSTMRDAPTYSVAVQGGQARFLEITYDQEEAARDRRKNG